MRDMSGCRIATLIFFATTISIACLAGCPGTPVVTQPQSVDDAPLRIRIAKAEATRGAGEAELVELAVHGKKPERVLALRALGRLGGARALDTLVDALGVPDAELRSAAAAAIGIATSLDETDAGTPRLTQALLKAWTPSPAFVEGVGRAADASAQRMLATCLQSESESAARTACAVALGRYGRRKIELSDAARGVLATAARDRDPSVRYAAVWAISREQLPANTDAAAHHDQAQAAILPVLALLTTDELPEVRAQACAALGRRKLAVAARAALELALRDRDWRVAVEAVRALTGESSDDAGRDAVAAILPVRFTQLERGEAPEAHVVIEALKGLAAHTGRAPIAAALSEIARRTAASKLPPLTRGWIECLAIAGTVRGASSPKQGGALPALPAGGAAAPGIDYALVEKCGHGGLPDHLRLPLMGELVTAKVGTLEARRAAIRTLLSHADARVRVAGITAYAAAWKDGEDTDHRAAIATVVAALGSPDPIVAGNAVDAATTIYEAIGTGDHAALDAAVIARAQIETDPELGASLIELIGKRTLGDGAPACRAGLDRAPVLAHAAAKCLEALGAPAAPRTALAAATAPPVDVAAVIGKRLRWHLLTTRGDVVIALRPDAAPWAVATIVTLTKRGFYDGLELHRVVPDFVAQGGDPTQSGWGGPGFAIPAEPSQGAGFVAGGVGIADAGRDSGGSQWFVMHSAAPHLDGRYTWIGSVESGQKSLDSLLIGDQVTRAIVEVVP
jgi:cyclophilin family peptidyl-prolyl cis-trans isomerase/HEAT repeat protein